MNSSAVSLFTDTRKALPQKERDLTVVTQADQIVLTLTPKPEDLKKIEGVQFIPEQGEVIDYMAPQKFSCENGQMTLSIKRSHPSQELDTIKGVLLLTEQGSQIKKAIQVDTSLDPSVGGTGVDHCPASP